MSSCHEISSNQTNFNFSKLLLLLKGMGLYVHWSILVRIIIQSTLKSNISFDKNKALQLRLIDRLSPVPEFGFWKRTELFTCHTLLSRWSYTYGSPDSSCVQILICSISSLHFCTSFRMSKTNRKYIFMENKYIAVLYGEGLSYTSDVASASPIPSRAKIFTQRGLVDSNFQHWSDENGFVRMHERIR